MANDTDSDREPTDPEDESSGTADKETADEETADEETDVITEQDMQWAAVSNTSESEGESDETDTAADEPSSEPSSPTERDREFAKMQRRLNEREMGLDQRSKELDKRAEKLDEREQELDAREADLDEREFQLDERESTLEKRADELDEREAELTEYDAQLAEQAAELEADEETLNTYLSGQVEEIEDEITQTLHAALDQYESTRGRFGPTGTILVGLSGLALVVAGLGFGALTTTGATTIGVGGSTTNLAIAAVVTIIGLAVNLGAVADRI